MTNEELIDEAQERATAVFGRGVALEVRQGEGWFYAVVWNKSGTELHLEARERTKAEALKELLRELHEREHAA